MGSVMRGSTSSLGPLPEKPPTLDVRPENIPAELKEGKRCTGWGWVYRPDNPAKPWTKPPLQPNGQRASSTNPSTWSTFDQALEGYRCGRYDGIGRVVAEDDNLVSTDIDNCRNPETGEISDAVWKLIRMLPTYWEVSPSGRGVRAWAKGKLPVGSRNKKGDIEMYDRKRYMTTTGHHLAGTSPTITACQEQLEVFSRFVFGEPVTPASTEQTGPSKLVLPDEPLLERARGAKNGAEFSRLFDDGDTSRHNNDHSAADLALCCQLAFWTTGNSAAMDRLFRRSALMRAKWDERHYGDGRTYGQATIERARQIVQDGWRPGGDIRGGAGRGVLVPGPPNGTSPSSTDGAPGHIPTVVCNNRPLRDLGGELGKADDAMRALAAANGSEPVIFERMRQLARVGLAVAGPSGDGHPVIELLSKDALGGELAQVALFVTLRQHPSQPDKAIQTRVSPPDDVVRDILARGQWEGIPALAGVVETPVIRPDGTLLNTTGYDRQTWLYYAPRPGFTLSAVPEQPSREQMQEAVSLLDEALGDFPFADTASRANAYALLLTPFVRHAMPEALVPMAIVDSPTPGTGKGLLVDLIGIVSTGRLLPKRSPARDADEWRKELVAAALEAPTFFVLDNITEPLGNGVLDLAVTAGTIAGRLLGHSRTATVPIRWVWVSTGNNVVVVGDLGRRGYWIRMESQLADPSKRTGFQHPQLLLWAQEERPRLVAAVLTLIRGWYAAGQPEAAVPTFGSFEQWSRTVGGILAHAGIEGFLTNLDSFRARADQSRGEWEDFIGAWWSVLGGMEITLGELTRRLLEEASFKPLSEALPSEFARRLDHARVESHRTFATALGMALNRVEGRRFGEPEALMFTKGKDARGKRTSWRVVRADTPDPLDGRRADSGAGPAGPSTPPIGDVDSHDRGKGDNHAKPAGPLDPRLEKTVPDLPDLAGPLQTQRSDTKTGRFELNTDPVAGPAGPFPYPTRTRTHTHAIRAERGGKGPAGPAEGPEGEPLPPPVPDDDGWEPVA